MLGKLKASGYTLMALSMFLYSLCDALGKYLTHVYEPAQIIFFRSSVALLFVVWISFKKRFPTNKHDIRLNIIYTIFAAFSLFLSMYSLKYLPLSTSSFMSYTSPIFITVLSYAYLKEKVSGFIILPIIIGFSGALIMSYPFQNINLNQGFMFASLASILYAAAAVIAKRLAHLDNFILYGSYTFVCFVLSAIFTYKNISIAINDIPLFILLATIHFLAFQCFIMACRREDLVRLSPLEYSTVVWAITFGYALWHYVPNFKELIGGLFILLGSAISQRKELKLIISKGIKRLQV